MLKYSCDLKKKWIHAKWQLPSLDQMTETHVESQLLKQRQSPIFVYWQSNWNKPSFTWHHTYLCTISHHILHSVVCFRYSFWNLTPPAQILHFSFAYRILEHYLKKLNRHGAFNSPKLTRRTHIFCILIIKLYTGKKQWNILDVLIWQKCQFFFSRQIWSILYWCSL